MPEKRDNENTPAAAAAARAAGYRNTIATIGDMNYLWGIFLLVASARKAGMREPFIVGAKDFTRRAESVLEQLGGVSFVRLDGATRSLACYKPHVMLKAATPFATWADSDAFFTGDVSDILPPADPDGMHFRLRAPDELPGLAWRRRFGGDGRSVPQPVLDAWRRDVEETAGGATAAPRFTTTGPSCFMSLSLERHRSFLESWRDLQEKVLPHRNVGVVDASLEFYPQLDESALNACLMFLPDAPRVQDRFMLDKERDRLFVHFIAQPKPWQGWTKRAFRFFDEYVAVVEWAAAQGYELPAPAPYCLKSSGKLPMRALIPWMTAKPKIAKRLRRFFRLK